MFFFSLNNNLVFYVHVNVFISYLPHINVNQTKTQTRFEKGTKKKNKVACIFLIKFIDRLHFLLVYDNLNIHSDKNMFRLYWDLKIQ